MVIRGGTEKHATTENQFLKFISIVIKYDF